MIQSVIEHIRFPTAICIMAGFVSLLYYHKLTFKERFILLLILLNIVADLTGNYVALQKKYNGDVYNLICPLEKIIIMFIYYFNTKKETYKMVYIIGMFLIIALSISGYALENKPGYMHTEIFIISGFFTAIVSYLHLRQIVLEKAYASTPIFLLGMANLIYYTLMISSMSAQPVANSISWDYAGQLYIGNDIAYFLWSITTLIGIIWNRTKI